MQLSELAMITWTNNGGGAVRKWRRIAAKGSTDEVTDGVESIPISAALGHRSR